MISTYCIPENIEIDTKSDKYKEKIKFQYPENEQLGKARELSYYNTLINEMPLNNQSICIINVTHCMQTSWASKINEILDFKYNV